MSFPKDLYIAVVTKHPSMEIPELHLASEEPDVWMIPIPQIGTPVSEVVGDKDESENWKSENSESEESEMIEGCSLLMPNMVAAMLTGHFISFLPPHASLSSIRSTPSEHANKLVWKVTVTEKGRDVEPMPEWFETPLEAIAAYFLNHDLNMTI